MLGYPSGGSTRVAFPYEGEPEHDECIGCLIER
jgi:hypothetical protein